MSFFVDSLPANCLFNCSALIDPEIFYWMWLQIVCGPYPNWTYGFYSPTHLCKFMDRVPVLWLHFHDQLIDCLQGNHLKIFLLIFVNIFSSGRINTEAVELIYAHYHQTRPFFEDILLSRFVGKRQEYNQGNKKLEDKVWWWNICGTNQLFK